MGPTATGSPGGSSPSGPAALGGSVLLGGWAPKSPGGRDRLVLKPLGLSIGGTGCDFNVPGTGSVDLHKAVDPSHVVDLGHVMIAELSAHLLGELEAEAPALHDRFDVGQSLTQVLARCGLVAADAETWVEIHRPADHQGRLLDRDATETIPADPPPHYGSLGQLVEYVDSLVDPARFRVHVGFKRAMNEKKVSYL